MPTLDQAARQLGISEKTLRRWIKVLNQKRPRQQIVPTRHEWDMRYFVISDEDVDAIREARAQMPGHMSDVIPPSSTLAFRRSESVEGRYSDMSPAQSATPRQRQPQREALRIAGVGLPAGMMSKTDAAMLHGVKETTLRTWCREGKIETAAGEYGGEAGRWKVRDPLTQRGLAMLFALASPKSGFRRCPDCPHTAVDASPPG